MWRCSFAANRAGLMRVQTLAQLTTQASYPPPAHIARTMPPRAVWLEAQRRDLVPVEEYGIWLLINADGMPRSRMLSASADSGEK